MGMAASQATFLSLTSRISDLELSAQQIMNSKIRLSDNGTEAARLYSKALDKQKMTVFSGLQNNGQSSYIDASAHNLTTYNAISTLDKQRFIKDPSGRVIVNSQTAKAYDNAMSENFGTMTGNKDKTATNLKAQYSTLEDFLKSSDGPGYATIEDFKASTPNATATQISDMTNQITYNTSIYNGSAGFLKGMGTVTDPNNSDYDASEANYNTNIFNEIHDSGYNQQSDDNINSSEWLQSNIDAGNIYLAMYDQEGGTMGNGDVVEESWTSGDASLQEKSDDTDMAKAEAKYKTTMASIQNKDKRFDLKLAQINTEHKAIQTEMDSVKKIIDKNIERSFKIFNG